MAKPLPLRNIIAFHFIAFFLSIMAFGAVWVLTAFGLVSLDIAAVPNVGGLILVIGMVLNMLVTAVISALYISEEPQVLEVTPTRKRLRTYSKPRLILKAALFSYVLNILLWFISANVYAFFLSQFPPVIQAQDLLGGFLELVGLQGDILVHFVAFTFGNPSAFWTAQGVTYAILSIFWTWWLAPSGRVKIKPRRKRPKKK